MSRVGKKPIVLPEKVEVDVQGRTVTVFKDAEVQAGSISVTWNGSAADGRPVGQGVYFLQARIDGRASRTERIVVIR